MWLLICRFSLYQYLLVNTLLGTKHEKSGGNFLLSNRKFLHYAMFLTLNLIPVPAYLRNRFWQEGKILQSIHIIMLQVCVSYS